MKWMTNLHKLKLKLAFHERYAKHGWEMSNIIIQWLRKLIEKQKLIDKE